MTGAAPDVVSRRCPIGGRPVVGRRAGLIAAALLLSGCISVEVGGTDPPPLVYYVLDDARPGAPVAAARGTAMLALHTAGSDPLADSTAIVYSRRAGERSLYQLAAWTEKPSRRLLRMAQQRLQARGAFAAVTLIGQPVDADWMLTLAIEQMFHDVGQPPGRAVLAVRAELLDRRQRRPVAQRLFTTAPAVAQATASAAVAAFGEAAADVLDQLAAWLEASVAAPARS